MRGGKPGPECRSVLINWDLLCKYPKATTSYKLNILPDQGSWQASNPRRWGLQPRSDFCLFTAPRRWTYSTLFYINTEVSSVLLSITEDNWVNYKGIIKAYQLHKCFRLHNSWRPIWIFAQLLQLQNRRVSYRDHESILVLDYTC